MTVKPVKAQKPADETPPIDDLWKNVQALIGRGFPHRHYSAHLLLKCECPASARQWLGGPDRPERPEIAMTYDKVEEEAKRKSEDRSPPYEPLLQLAFSPHGLLKLGVPQSAMGGFSDPFLAGMAPPPHGPEDHSRRAGVLGDVGPNHQSKWDWGGGKHEDEATDEEQKRRAPWDEIDILYMIYVGRKKTPDGKCFLQTEDVALQQIDDLIAAVLSPQTGLRLAGGDQNPKTSPACIRNRLYLRDGDRFAREHFGFLDGVSQPMINGLPREQRAKRERPETHNLHAVAVGEFILGYENEREKVTPYPELDEIGRYGSYLVVRQLEQHVGAFNRLVKSAATAMDFKPETKRGLERAAAKLMGRYRGGRALTPVAREKDGLSSFGFAARDSEGLCCPVSSHIRRANPRDSKEDSAEIALRLSKRHRIMRRGRIYGEPTINKAFDQDDTPGRGLLFMCLNADIAQQFEFIQQTWLNNATFAGMDREVDPIISTKIDGERFTIPDRPAPATVTRKDRLTTMKGGGYFFMPGKPALDRLLANTWTEDERDRK